MQAIWEGARDVSCFLDLCLSVFICGSPLLAIPQPDRDIEFVDELARRCALGVTSRRPDEVALCGVPCVRSAPLRFPRALASHDGEHGCVGRYVVEWSEAGENLEWGEQGTVAGDRRRYGLAS